LLQVTGIVVLGRAGFPMLFSAVAAAVGKTIGNAFDIVGATGGDSETLIEHALNPRTTSSK